ncbi:hypothetical protein A7982_12846 [Minicystis rosea]|nr:hypothetical protein A7982_12846 [Minicystis rosea]
MHEAGSTGLVEIASNVGQASIGAPSSGTPRDPRSISTRGPYRERR